MTTTAVVLADTHMRAGSARRLPAAADRWLVTADLILHAGDVVDHALLDRLAAIAPVHAVLGNNDHALRGALPETLEFDVNGVAVALIHDSGPSKGREARLHRRFPDAAVVVFGHSHIPWNDQGVDGQLLFNPGSPTERRRQPHRTLGLLRFDGGRIVEHTIHIVDD